MIITSLLDTDLYKFTMMQMVFHHFSTAMVEYRFHCRAPGIDLSPYHQQIRQEVKELCQLKLQTDELNYLASLEYFSADFLEFLRFFQLNDDFVCIDVTQNFSITIKGPWLHTILFEVPLLAIINQVYYQGYQTNLHHQEGTKRLNEKIHYLKEQGVIDDFHFVEFGTRRRFSFEWQEQIIRTFKASLPQSFMGTSNLYYARKLGLTPIGTMAHEYLQACQVLGPHLIDSQKFALEMWAKEYRGKLAIALSDVYTLDVFLKDFDLFFCKLYDGARHDSGDPFVWGDRVIDHYQAQGIDSRTKTLIFSDSLDFKQSVKLFKHFHKKAKLVFAIGTFLTNDLGFTPLQNVIKMVYCNNLPVAKISDSASKTMSPNSQYVTYLKSVFNISN